jgi:hypothetical protein
MKLHDSEKTELIPYTTVTKMAAIYAKETAEMLRLVQALDESGERLRKAFEDGNSYAHDFKLYVRCFHNRDADLNGIMLYFRQQAWRSIVSRLGIEKIMSIAARNQFQKQLDEGKDLPDISEETILGVLSQWASQTQDLAKEAVKEIFEWLRPYRSLHKTNCAWKIGKKVIQRYMVERTWTRDGFRVKYDKEKYLIALDTVFHLLDGKGPLKGNRGPLVDGINTSTGTGETDYFKFRCFKNTNLHIQFKRLDLVKELNRTAVGRYELGDDES